MKQYDNSDLADNLIIYKMQVKEEIEQLNKNIDKASFEGEDNGYLEEMCHKLRSLHDKLANIETLLRGLEN